MGLAVLEHAPTIDFILRSSLWIRGFSASSSMCGGFYSDRFRMKNGRLYQNITSSRGQYYKPQPDKAGGGRAQSCSRRKIASRRGTCQRQGRVFVGMECRLFYQSIIALQTMLGLGIELNGLSEIRRYKTEFEEVEKIGHGGFSTVFKARHRLDNQFYAVKKMKIKPADHRPNLQEYFDKVMREGKVLCEINHPNVLKYHSIWFEVGQKVKPKPRDRDPEPPSDTSEFEMIIDSEDSQNSSSICFADPAPKQPKEHTPERKPQPAPKMERNKSDKKEPSSSEHPIDYRWLLDYSDVTIYIQAQLCKETLNEFVDKRRAVRSGADPTSLAENYRMVLDLVDGIECLHNRKIIHRDIKMHNILLDFQGKCKICDFGLAKRSKGSKSCFILTDIIPNGQLTEEELDKFSSSVGTKIFSSPEQSTSSSYDHRTDIYSLGIIIGMLFSTWKTKHEEFELINKIRSRSAGYLNIDPRVISIVERCMSDPQYRPSLKQIRKCFIDLLNPPMLVSLRFPSEDGFKERMAIVKSGVLYIGENNKYTCMLKMKDITIQKGKEKYTIQRNGRPAFEVEEEGVLLEALTTS